MAFGEHIAQQAEHERVSTLSTVEWNGCQVVNASSGDTISWLMDSLDAGNKRRLCFTSAHPLSLARHDPYLATALRGMDALLPDGSGVATVKHETGHRLWVNLNPRDLVPAILQALPVGTRFFQLGARRAITKQVALNLSATWPHLKLVGCQDNAFQPWDSAQVVQKINRACASVVLVGMETPRQELWMERYASQLEAELVLGVGSLFDFAANHLFERRCPADSLRTKGTWQLRVGGPTVVGSPPLSA
ncbi:MAG: WecB/TagA/CpsF family glycosyltransferase [Pseudomonadota bacterium]